MAKSKGVFLLAVLFLVAGIYCAYTAYDIHQNTGIFVFSGDKGGKLSDSETLKELEEFLSKDQRMGEFNQALRKDRSKRESKGSYILLSITFFVVSIALFFAGKRKSHKNGE